MKTSFVALVILVIGFVSPAGAVELYLWHSKPEVLPIVLPVREGEAPVQAAHRYLRGLRAPELANVFTSTPVLPFTRFERLGSDSLERRALLLSNDQKDFGVHARIDAFKSVFAKPPVQMQSYLMPVVADTGLTAQERLEFFAKVREAFPFVVPMGGPDVHPALYGEEVTGAKDVNLARDRFEFDLLRYLLQDTIQEHRAFVNDAVSTRPDLQIAARERRVNRDPHIFAICHGEQMVSAALGYKLVQDVPTEVTDALTHEGGTWHDVELLSIEGRWIESIVANALGIGQKMRVNSYHHQSVAYRDGGPLQLAARSKDGVTEALVSRDGRIMALQFHTEFFFRAGDDAQTFLGESLMLTQARRAQQKLLSAKARFSSSAARDCREVFAR